MVRTCPRCFATIIDDEASVCPGCRSSLPAEKPIEPSETMRSFSEIRAKIESYRVREASAFLLAIICIVAGMLVIELFARGLLEWCVGALLEITGVALISLSINWERKRNHLKRLLRGAMARAGAGKRARI
ncbi:MAG: hypothetical protein QMD95_00015 [Candidatus Hodarchaeaceae archaeon]|nr:hypothetical protein [Candidatus Hodarchaeaceae archaeon]